MPDNLPPTPWRIIEWEDEIGGLQILAANNSVVCYIRGGPHAQALAQLLSAAPELLERAHELDHARIISERLANALSDLLDVIETDELIPESVSYMRQAREMLEQWEESEDAAGPAGEENQP